MCLDFSSSSPEQCSQHLSEEMSPELEVIRMAVDYNLSVNFQVAYFFFSQQYLLNYPHSSRHVYYLFYPFCFLKSSMAMFCSNII